MWQRLPIECVPLSAIALPLALPKRCQNVEPCCADRGFHICCGTGLDWGYVQQQHCTACTNGPGHHFLLCLSLAGRYRNTKIRINWDETVNADRNSRCVDPLMRHAGQTRYWKPQKQQEMGRLGGHIEFRGRGGCKRAHVWNTSKRGP
jgi:hypothetical protein